MRTMNTLPAMLEENMEAIRALCRKYRVKRLAVFGSAATGTFDPARNLLGRSVALVQPAAVRNPYSLQNLEETQRNIYAASATWSYTVTRQSTSLKSGR
jgi:predicted nucleotidyltransferase